MTNALKMIFARSNAALSLVAGLYLSSQVGVFSAGADPLPSSSGRQIAQVTEPGQRGDKADPDDDKHRQKQGPAKSEQERPQKGSPGQPSPDRQGEQQQKQEREPAQKRGERGQERQDQESGKAEQEQKQREDRARADQERQNQGRAKADEQKQREDRARAEQDRQNQGRAKADEQKQGEDRARAEQDRQNQGRAKADDQKQLERPQRERTAPSGAPGDRQNEERARADQERLNQDRVRLDQEQQKQKDDRAKLEQDRARSLKNKDQEQSLRQREQRLRAEEDRLRASADQLRGREDRYRLEHGRLQNAERRLDRLQDIQEQRRERVEAGGQRTIIEEPDRRVIIREQGRSIIRHDETARFSRLNRDVRTDRRRDGVTLNVFARRDGGEVVSESDDEGRLLRRYRRDQSGREIVLIDNRDYYRRRGRGEGFVFIDLPAPRITIPREKYIVDYSAASGDDLYEALTAPPVVRIDRSYSLEEVRRSHPVRERMRRVDLDDINFEFGSWEITGEELPKLERLAKVIKSILERRPREVFLIEGHTDAVGSDVDNLTLSDRRAESVAVILSDSFEVSPENLTTQGYGEQFLKVDTQDAERSNRRVAVRRITPLLSKVGDTDRRPDRR